MKIASISTILLALGTMVSVAQDYAVDFNRDVRPILTKNCTTCHGGVKKAGDVSYLYREDTLGKGESGKTIVVPGDPDASEMIRRILTADSDGIRTWFLTVEDNRNTVVSSSLVFPEVE